MPRRDSHLQTSLSGLPEVGDILDGKYRIDWVLGFGGMGVVFAATHLRLAQRVAIKMLLPQWMSEPSVVQRFAREGRASAAIRSEHIVRVLDVDECDGKPYLVLEYLEGKDFAKLLAEDGPLPVASAVDLVLQACEALAEAHAVGTIHRDLKPANLFLTAGPNGEPCVKVLDFGISKIASKTFQASTTISMGATQPRTVMGSPQYMSPEQMQSSRDVDERSDIWALGAILHELLAGSPPFGGDSLTEVCAHVMTDPPPRLARVRDDVPTALDGVVLRCLEKRRWRRYGNVAELARALAGFGTEAARASAIRISRTLEGGIAYDRTSFDRQLPVTNRLVSELDIPQGIGRPIGGYLLAATMVVAALAGAGWQIAKQESAIRAARRPSPPPEAVPIASVDIPPVPVPAAVTTRSSITSTTGAVVPVPATAEATSQASARAPAPTAAPASKHVHRLPRKPTLPAWATHSQPAAAAAPIESPAPADSNGDPSQ